MTIPPGQPISKSQTILDEMYTLLAMLEVHKEIQQLEIANQNCWLPCVVAAVMLGSNRLQLSTFSTKKVWVFYMWLGNLSKYKHCKHNLGSCYELAHISSLLDKIKDRIAKLNGCPLSASLLTHLCSKQYRSELHTSINRMQQGEKFEQEANPEDWRIP
ncbi:hypothetical protein B0J17DRAFT_634287 [Rhizoctonia solani]|nr:hypothetical protein B0J17DRAFT_634287 [Rhizoctonia solani]